MQLFLIFHCSKWAQWREVAFLQAWFTATAAVCCAAWLMFPSIVNMFLFSSHPFPYQPVLAVTHQFAALISHFSPSRLCIFLVVLFSGWSFCFSCLIHVKDDSTLCKNTVLKYSPAGLLTSAEAGFCVWHCQPSLISWHCHALKRNCSWTWAYICVWGCGQYF